MTRGLPSVPGVPYWVCGRFGTCGFRLGGVPAHEPPDGCGAVWVHRDKRIADKLVYYFARLLCAVQILFDFAVARTEVSGFRQCAGNGIASILLQLPLQLPRAFRTVGFAFPCA